MSKVLVVDDQEGVRTALSVLLEVNGIAAVTAADAEDALALVRDEDIGVVIQDMNFTQSEVQGREGISLFRAIRGLDPDLPVLLMTAWTSLETAVALVKEGAADYFAKPWDDQKLVRSVQNLLRLRQLHHENVRLRAESSRAREELAARHDLCGLVYGSAQMHGVVSLAVHVAPSDAPVLITGPNGSGKEKVAEIVRANSRRRDKPFVPVDAGSLPDELLTAELFGAEPGAYTGASKLRIGRFEAANGGTLFLDEIGNLSAAGQAKLLRVLQTGEYERLGSSHTRRADVRLISATNLDLARAIRSGAFREDLYFRINVIELRLPALADRVDDIAPLAEHFLARHAPAGSRPGLTEEARERMLAHEWPGNVRELQNRIQRACLVAKGDRIAADDLGLGADAPRPAAPAPAPPTGGEQERERIEGALTRAAGVVSRAAAELGLSRQALYRRMERLGIVLERRPRS